MVAAVPYIALGLTAASAVGQYQAGKAQAASMQGQADAIDAQSEVTKLAGRQNALQHKRQAVASLDNVLRAMASNNARAGAGHIDPSSGSISAVNNEILSIGVRDVQTASANETITRDMASYQALLQRDQAKRLRAGAPVARRNGVFNAMAVMGQGIMSGAQVGAFGSNTSAKGNILNNQVKPA